MNPLLKLREEGQSIWLDYIRRSLITSGGLQRLIDEDGLRGVTSNPTIFEKAIEGSTDYDETLRAALRDDPGASARTLYDRLSIEDVQAAADLLRPVYDATGGGDGFVSLEPPPQATSSTENTITEARRLWQAVNRPNLMIKVVATPDGVAAVEALIAQGINVNITLMFSLAHYEAVSHAYIRGLEHCREPGKVSSVASFFVSRVDTKVDRALDANGSPEALALRGRIAICNAKLAYRRFREIFHGQPFAALRQRGARVQRPLWASTSTKNPTYRDVLYVEELIGPETVNTLPPATLDAFRDHGHVRDGTLLHGLDEAEAAIAQLGKLGIDLNAIAEELQVEGIASFASSYDHVIAALEKKRQAIVAGPAEEQSFRLGASQSAVEQRLREWEETALPRRLWAKDPTIWARQPGPELSDRLGWLNLPESVEEDIAEFAGFAASVRAEGFRNVVLLGMGGSSLAPEMLHRTFGSAPGFPQLAVLDSTHPAAVKAVESTIRIPDTLFIVSSKSGTTTETLSLFRYFWQRVAESNRGAGNHFIAITDPGTPLEKLAQDRGFRRVFLAPPDVGGRFSALSAFGLVPAALIGVDLPALTGRARRMAEASAFCVPADQNPGLMLGAALGELAAAGRDKLTFVAPPAFNAFPYWLEQLIAESTGKDGKGIVPIVNEPVGVPEVYGADRAFVHFRLSQDTRSEVERRIAELESAGNPVVRINVRELIDTGAEFFRWEVAVAAASAVIGVQPFNQPDVQLAKDLARKAMSQRRPKAEAEAASASSEEQITRELEGWLAGLEPGSYIAIQAFLAPSRETSEALQNMRIGFRRGHGVAATAAYGPRFLHSTGQLHKGGPNTGLFLQLTDRPAPDLPVPETDYTFGALIDAQARGDYEALRQRGRRVLRVDLGSDVAGGLARITAALERPKARRSGK